MKTRISPATMQLVSWSFNTVADMKAELRLDEGDYVMVAGIATPGDVAFIPPYRIASAATAVDGYVDHRLDNGLAAVLDHGAYFHAEWAGAVAGVEASAQLNAAFAHLRSWKAANGNPDVLFVHSSTCTLANQVAIATAGGARLTGVNIDFSNSFLTAVAGGNLSATVAMVLAKVRGDAYWGQMDGGKFAAAYDFSACAGSRFYNPAGTRFKGFGIRVAGSSGSLTVYGPLLNEYEQADVEFNTQANFTARGISCEDGDWNCVGGNVKWCKVPLYTAPGVVGCHFDQCHWVNGNPNYDAGSEPIVLLGMGQSNMVGNAASTSGDHTIAAGVYVWNGDYNSHGTAFAPAAFGTAPFDVGAPPYANNLMIHAANSLAASTGRDVYIIMVADGGRKIECFLTPEVLAANGWTSAVDFTPFMYPDIVVACEAVPNRVSPFPDLILWQQGEANNADSAAVYQAKLEALIDDLSAHGVLYGGSTKFTVGGLVPVHAFYNAHKTACENVDGIYSFVKYIPTTGLADTDGVHFTGEALVTLGTAHATAFTYPAAAVGGPPFIDSILIENYATRTNHFDNNYFDNGLVHDYSGTMNITGGHYVKNNRAAFNHPYIRLYATEVGQLVAPGFKVVGLGGKCSIGCLPNGSFTWAGDWDEPQDQYSSMDNDNNAAQMMRTQYNLWSASTAKIEWNYKSQGKFRLEWQVGVDKLVVNYDPENGTFEVVGKVKAQTLNLSALPTSAAGLVAGDVWNDTGVLKVV